MWHTKFFKSATVDMSADGKKRTHTEKVKAACMADFRYYLLTHKSREFDIILF